MSVIIKKRAICPLFLYTPFHMKVIILAAGKGTRLQPFTHTTPKPLLPLRDNVTILDSILENLPDEINEVIIIIAHLGHVVRDFVSNRTDHRKITLVEQDENLSGTMGALLSAKHLLGTNESFLVMNGDDLQEKNELEKFIQDPNIHTFGVQKSIMPGYLAININAEGYVTGFRDQTDEEKANGALVATGTYFINASLFSFDPEPIFGGAFGLPQTIVKHLETNPIKAVETHHWKSINTHEDLEYAQKMNK